jgi:hypothetical protein
MHSPVLSNLAAAVAAAAIRRSLGVVLLAAGLVVTQVARAEEAVPETTPLTDFRKQVGTVRDGLLTLNKRIEQSAKEIETLSTPVAARKQMDELQVLLAQTLGMVADNGEIATLGDKALAYSRSKLEQMHKDTKFDPQDRATLQQIWQRNTEEMERAVNELAAASRDFARQLRIIQTRGDYAAELAEAENAKEMIEVIKRLAGEVRSASEIMKTYIRTLMPPSS